MAQRSVFNFSAGPAILPEEVLREAQEALWELDGSGIGVLEHSHRGANFDAVYEQTLADCRSVAGIPDEYEVLLLQGGASTQFFMLPANYLPEEGTADYLVTGAWAEKAAKEARFYGHVHEAWAGEKPYTRIPRANEIEYSAAPAYVHFASNNTIFGTQWNAEPEIPAGSWLACDASSDIFSRPIDVTKYGMIYAGAQKNLGPSGVTLVILRRDLLAEGTRVRELPTMQRYDRKNGSMHNTPSTFGIYLMGRVFQWILRGGGLQAMGQRNREKASVLYDALEELDGFYTCTAGEGSRSAMNVTFRARDEATEKRFVAEAEAAGFSGLKGHRDVGGMRASIYNAFPKEGCEAFAEFLRDFAKRNG
jgi:phosphoserine aminotransferase